MGQSQEYLKREFVHYISDTIALLGGNKEIVEMIRRCEEKPFTPQLIEELRKYNGTQLDKVRLSLALLDTEQIAKEH